jgi:magnesium transporter
MVKRHKRISVARAGTVSVAPGTLTAPPDAHPARISVIAYSAQNLVEEVDVAVERIAELRGQHPVTWVNLDGLADIALLQSLGEMFGLHRLALEDTVNIHQRPKLDDYEGNLYIVARMPVAADTLETEQISLFLGEGFLLTVQERPGDCLESVRNRLREGRTRIRERGSDYLAYAVLDAVIDAYFPLLETSAVKLEEIELAILEGPYRQHVTELHDLKHNFITLRRYLGPLLDLVAAFMRDESPYVTDQTRTYLRDCYDHAKQANDLVDSYRDVATGLMDLYLSMMSQRMNEVMKVLTIIATVFIPLSFIAGLYGMNFDPQASRWNMPELAWSFGYPLALAAMAVVAGFMLAYFWRKGWFR